MSAETRKPTPAQLEAATAVVLDPHGNGTKSMDRAWALYRARRILEASSLDDAARFLDGIDWICGRGHNRMVAEKARTAAASASTGEDSA